MKLSFHGGKCCGIKVISGFSQITSDYSSHRCRCSAEFAHPEGKNDVDAMPGTFSHRKDEDFFTDAAPSEPVVDRFKRLVAFCEHRRPQGLIEVTLIDAQIKQWGWGEVLEELAFKPVVRFMNSNSRNFVTVYHRVSGVAPALAYEKHVPDETKPKPIPDGIDVVSAPAPTPPRF